MLFEQYLHLHHNRKLSGFRAQIVCKRSREKPIVKRRFVRIKETLYCYKDGRIKVSVKPYEECLEFDISKAWFWSKVPRSAEMGELILHKEFLTMTFGFSNKEENPHSRIAWDGNEKSIDGWIQS